MKLRAQAFINIFLKKIGQQYQLINIPIDLFDSIHIKESKENAFTCDKFYIPTNDKNSIVQTVKLFQKKFTIPPQEIHLVKNIPSLAGLGGRSSNAATMINYFNEYYELGLSRKQRLELANEISSEAMYCIDNQAVMVDKDKVIPIDRQLYFYAFVLKPNFGISSKDTYDDLLSIENNKSIDECVEALKENEFDRLIENMHNDYESIAIEKYPKLKDYMEELEAFGFDKVMISATGSSVYGLTMSDDLADQAVQHYFDKVPFVKKSRMFG